MHTLYYKVDQLLGREIRGSLALQFPLQVQVRGLVSSSGLWVHIWEEKEGITKKSEHLILKSQNLEILAE